MPYRPEAYAYSPVNYDGESGSIPALLLYKAGNLSYVRFLVQSAWPHYDGWSKWTTVGLFTEHVVTVDPHEPAMADLLGELEREAARMRQYAKNRGSQLSKPKQANDQCVQAPATAKPVEKRCDPRVTTGQPKPSKIKLNGKEFSSRSPARIRQIGGLSLRDFLGNR